MTREFFDNNGQALDRDSTADPDGTSVEWTPEYEAQYKATQERALKIAAMFSMLADADGDYWPAIEMETMARHSLRNHRAADVWKEIVARKRARFYAQIKQEMNEDGTV
jgi:hypothetical protein